MAVQLDVQQTLVNQLDHEGCHVDARHGERVPAGWVVRLFQRTDNRNIAQYYISTASPNAPTQRQGPPLSFNFVVFREVVELNQREDAHASEVRHRIGTYTQKVKRKLLQCNVTYRA